MAKILAFKREDGGVGYTYVEDDYAPKANEAFVDEEPSEEARWDDAANAPREPTVSESLEELKAERRRYLEGAYAGETAASFGVSPEWPGVALGVALANPGDTRIEALKTRSTKLQGKLEDVEAAGNETDIKAVVW